ncbi:cell division protein PerM [Streptomyces sp. RKAG337]|uniref:cell division protein PerM n=1 Tax=Streptomyces sp. RKAG337 TaxID=2893404 RepID=UPI0020345E46|nr:DUF6350 family protein [Streptomyces sp. RKAG337]MCM2426644.1 DUF6350 family protein [Streptomyces sp. RKAG337]
MTDGFPSLPERAADARRASAAAAAFSGGVVAAGLGLGALAVTVLFLWISAPFPDSGLDGALRIAADLWLLAHGASLLRTDTLSGLPAPVGVTPLLLTVLPGWLLYRAAAHAVSPPEGEGEGAVEGGDGSGGPTELRVAAAAAGWLVAGYLLVGVGAVLYTSYGQVRSDPLSAFLHLPVVAVLAAGAGAWSGCGRPAVALPRAVRRWLDELSLPRWLTLPAGGLPAALRAAAASTAVLVGGGALLGGASLVWHERLVGHSFAQLSAPLSGRCAVLLVALALVPNMAVWGASYALGPGFAVGAGSVVAPAGLGAYGPGPGSSWPAAVPNFPLLGALPAPGATPLSWAVLGLPVLAGLCAAWLVGGAAAAGSWRPARTALVAALAALGCGAATGLLAGWSAGPMGSAVLADFGPRWWAAGGAALGWTLVVGVAGAVGVRWWHVRVPVPAEPVSWGERWGMVRGVFRWRWSWSRSEPVPEPEVAVEVLEMPPMPVVPPVVPPAE